MKEAYVLVKKEKREQGDGGVWSRTTTLLETDHSRTWLSSTTFEVFSLCRELRYATLLVQLVVDKRMDGRTECYCTTDGIDLDATSRRTDELVERWRLGCPARVRLSSTSSSSSRLLAAYLTGIIAVALQARALDNLGPCSAIGWPSF